MSQERGVAIIGVKETMIGDVVGSYGGRSDVAKRSTNDTGKTVQHVELSIVISSIAMTAIFDTFLFRKKSIEVRV